MLPFILQVATGCTHIWIFKIEILAAFLNGWRITAISWILYEAIAPSSYSGRIESGIMFLIVIATIGLTRQYYLDCYPRKV